MSLIVYCKIHGLDVTLFDLLQQISFPSATGPMPRTRPGYTIPDGRGKSLSDETISSIGPTSRCLYSDGEPVDGTMLPTTPMKIMIQTLLATRGVITEDPISSGC